MAQTSKPPQWVELKQVDRPSKFQSGESEKFAWVQVTAAIAVLGTERLSLRSNHWLQLLLKIHRC